MTTAESFAVINPFDVDVTIAATQETVPAGEPATVPADLGVQLLRQGWLPSDAAALAVADALAARDAETGTAVDAPLETTTPTKRRTRGAK